MSADGGRFAGFGLVFDSVVDLPLVKMALADQTQRTSASSVTTPAPDVEPQPAPDVVVRFEAVSEPDGSAEMVGVLCAATPTTCWIDVPEVARYEISNGTRIIIAPAPNSDPAAVRAFLISSAIGALFHQRRCLTLTASLVAKNGRAVAIISHAGEGQSTLAATLAWSGFEFLGDDINRFSGFSKGPPVAAPMVYPGTTSARLWPDTLARSERDPENYRRVCKAIAKREVPLAGGQRVSSEALPLDGILIVGAGSSDSIASRELSGRERFAALSSHTWRRRLVGACGYRNEHFADLACLASNIRVSSIMRPRNGEHFDETAALAESIIEGWSQSE